MKEHDVQAVLVSYLLERGWSPTIDNPDHVDVRATRGAETLIIEVKGNTSDPYTDTDTLLRVGLPDQLRFRPCRRESRACL